MIFAVVCAVLSVAAGTVLGLSPRLGRSTLSAVQTFALSAGLSVVVVHLLPESAEALGAWTFAAFFGGAMAPWVVERALGASHDHAHDHAHPPPHRPAHDLATEMGYLGLLAHQIGDGVGLSLTGLSPSLGPDAALALSAHTVPVTCLFVMKIAARHGARSALRHALGLAVATVGGIAVGAAVPPAALHAVEPWITAVVGGLLLHVICHDLAPERPRSTAMRSLDLAAMVVGLWIALAGSHARLEGFSQSALAHRGFVHALLDLAIQSAPVCLAGLALAAFARRWKAGIDGVPRPGALEAARGVLFGFWPQPGKPLERARSLLARRAPAAHVAAYLFAAPATSLWTVLLTWQFFTLSVALVRLALSIAIAWLAAVVIGFAAPHEERGSETSTVERDEGSARPLDAFGALVLGIAPWMVVGLVVAAYADALIPAGQLAPIAAWRLDVPLFALAAIPSVFCAGSIVPVAAVLMGKGISGGAVLCALLLGPATSVGGFRLVRRAYGTRAAVAGHAVFVAAAVGAALAMDAVMRITPDLWMERARHEHPAFALGAVAVLAAFGARSIWAAGLPGWLATVMDFGDEEAGSGLGRAGLDQAADPEQDHAHEHEGHLEPHAVLVEQSEQERGRHESHAGHLEGEGQDAHRG